MEGVGRVVRWPWVSVARLDDAQEQVAWLQGRVEDLEQHLRRVQRFEAGMAESVPKPKERELLPMPQELKEHIADWDNPAQQKHMRDIAYRRHARGETWDVIMDDVLGAVVEK